MKGFFFRMLSPPYLLGVPEAPDKLVSMLVGVGTRAMAVRVENELIVLSLPSLCRRCCFCNQDTQLFNLFSVYV